MSHSIVVSKKIRIFAVSNSHWQNLGTNTFEIYYYLYIFIFIKYIESERWAHNINIAFAIYSALP